MTIREERVRPKLWLQLTMLVAVPLATLFGCANGDASDAAKSPQPQSAHMTTDEVKEAITMNGWPRNLTEVRSYGKVGEPDPKIVHYAVVLEHPIERYKYFGWQRMVIWADGKHGLAMAEINVLPSNGFSIEITYNGNVRTISAPEGRIPLEHHPKEQPVEWPVRTPAFLSYSYFSQLEEAIGLGLAKSEYDALLQGVWLGTVSDDLLLMYEEGDGESSGIFVIKVTAGGDLSTQKLSAEFQQKPMREQYDDAIASR